MRSEIASLLAFGTLSASAQPSTSPSSKGTVACPRNTVFRPISASQWVKAASPGWNLGNTLDAVPDEGSWNNPPVQGHVFDDVKAAGYKSVRIPVTYADHYVGSTPDWTINSTWLKRVSDVVDMATSRGLYVLTNMHHDSWRWADVSQPDANITMIQEKFYQSWLQIGKTLGCKSEMVALEPINEPPGSSATDAQNLMKLNDIFLKALADSGGFNGRRVVTLSSLGMGLGNTPLFTRPTNITNPWAFQFHYYSPYDFDFGAWGKTVWGSEADKATVLADFTQARGNFTDVPIIMGEFDASQLNCEAAARWKWFDHVVRTASSLDISGFLWDNGLDNLQRETGTWRDAIAVDITMHAIRGANNSLADSTTDVSATVQNSSAYIFHKVGDNVTDQQVPFLLNGNAFRSLSVEGTPLKKGTDYDVSGSTLTIKEKFLSKYLSPTAEPGTKANITRTFSAGAKSQIEIVQWDVPTIIQNTSSASAVSSGNDLWIPVVWKGLHRVAAVKIVASDGTYVFDDWTQWLPPLQQGRGTYGNQWSFDFDRLTITNSALQAVITSGKTTTFTFEFYPRAVGNGNYLNYTLTP
ncbi:glycoside hydrolase [Coniochaeta ligniaria NRRL 30616]|uniref:Glycoside hydrolase n=1 Tax=Coniochaeta ligniaria NRRL 30616 TaxID=1408157 RepID=A0A1J7IDD5_9PEZI|nr:glycoside hydrolase [Coniochaeta ligniaria NRRL 30616]